MKKITVIIPTFDRHHDIVRTLDCLLEQTLLPHQLIIVDQSTQDDTKVLCQDPKYAALPLEYYTYGPPSLTRSRNFGLTKLADDTDVVSFLDDDTILENDFLYNLNKFMEDNPKAVGGMANIYCVLSPSAYQDNYWKLFRYACIVLLFTLRFRFDSFYVTSGGINTFPVIWPSKKINIQWTEGCGMFFAKKIFDEGFRFEERFEKYSNMEDVFFSYPVYKKYPKGLFFVPDMKMKHMVSTAARITNKAKTYQRILQRYIFVQQHKLSMPMFWYSTIIRCITETARSRSWSIVRYYIACTKYILTHQQDLKRDDFNINTFIFS